MMVHVRLSDRSSILVWRLGSMALPYLELLFKIGFILDKVLSDSRLSLKYFLVVNADMFASRRLL